MSLRSETRGEMKRWQGVGSFAGALSEITRLRLLLREWKEVPRFHLQRGREIECVLCGSHYGTHADNCLITRTEKMLEDE